jgi:NADH-quinone oxidoreductase subunit J
VERLIFDAAGALAVAFALVMVMQKHPVKSVLGLVVSFFGLAACYVMLSAPFLAAIQVIVYAGAILVLFLFVLMLLNVPQEARERDPRRIQQWVGSAAILVFGIAFVSVLASSGSDVPVRVPFDRAAAADIPALSRRLFSDYLLAFEAVSVLLLAALVGAFALAQKEKRP